MVLHSLAVGVCLGMPLADSNMILSILTQRYINPPMFSLMFNVSNGPPTNISCTVNGSDILAAVTRVIGDSMRSVTVVTVKGLREAGNYQCTVTNNRVTDDTLNSVSSLDILG